MSSTAHEFDFQNEGKAPGGAFFDSVETTSVAWQHEAFALSEQNIFGSALPTNPSARLRSVAYSIQAVVPMATAELQGQSAPDALDSMNKWLLSDAKIGGRAYRRSELYAPDDIVASMWIFDLEPTNHPIVQAWTAVQQLNQARSQHNASHARANQVKVLADQELDDLARDLVLSLKNQTVKERYDTLIKTQQRVSRKNDHGLTMEIKHVV